MISKQKKIYDTNYRQTHKEQIRAYSEKYNQSHKIQKREWSQKYYQLHKEQISIYRKKYQQSHKNWSCAKSKKYRQAHPDRVNEINRKYRQSHREQVNKKQREYMIKHRKKYRQSHREYMAKWRQEPKNHLDRVMGNAILKALKSKKVGRRWETLVGYTVEDLIKHLEKQFEPWMNWDNYGKWEIDHIKPRSLFRYETAEDPEFKKCWGLQNLQPMEHIANIKKSNYFISS